VDHGDDRPRALQDPEHGADDEDEEDDVAGLDHPPRDRTQKPLETHRAGVTLALVTDEQAFERVAFGQRLVRSGYDDIALDPADNELLALVVARRDEVGEQAAEQDNAGKQREHVRDLDTLQQAFGHPRLLEFARRVWRDRAVNIGWESRFYDRTHLAGPREAPVRSVEGGSYG
jgi:hypothetical protein